MIINLTTHLYINPINFVLLKYPINFVLLIITKQKRFSMNLFKILLVLSISSFLFTSCAEDEDKDPVDTIPTSYNFINADFSGQTERLNQLDEMISYIKTANTGAKVETQVLLDMYSNKDDNGGGNFSFSSTKQLNNKTAEDAKIDIISYFSTLSEISGTNEDASNGKAGLLKSGTKQYLVAANGFEYKEMIEKGLMGACLLDQITNGYLSFDKMNVDNTNLVEGKNYTTMQHHWDEAFGYVGANIDWNTNKEDVRYWAKYSNKSNSEITNWLMDSPTLLMNAFIKGRYAIDNKNYTERDKQIAIIIKQLEIVSATTAISYLNGSMKNFSDDAIRCHQLSEAYGCIKSLNYINSQYRVISKSQIDALINDLGDNFYDVTNEQLTKLRDDIAIIYNLESVKANF